MKPQSNFLRKSFAIAISLFLLSGALFAEGLMNEVYMAGNTLTNAGKYVVQATDEVYHYQGDEYKVFNVFYDDPGYNMKIAVKEKRNSQSFIAYNGDYWFQYKTSQEGFGVRRAMFETSKTKALFDAVAFHDQVIISDANNVKDLVAINMIASNLPKMKE